MANEYQVPPFGAPMSSFIQTGNISMNALEETIPEFSDSSEEDQISSQTTQSPTNLQFGGFKLPQQNQQQKYQIIDLFWLFNPGLYTQPQKIIQGQAHVAIISFNISFSNLRVSFFNLTQNSLINNVAFLNNMQRLVSGTIYPSSAFCIYSLPRIATICIEQLFQSTGAEWQQNRPVCKVEKNENKIRLTIEDQKIGSFFYDFEGWQREAFLYCCQFAFTTGTYLHGLNQIK